MFWPVERVRMSISGVGTADGRRPRPSAISRSVCTSDPSTERVRADVGEADLAIERLRAGVAFPHPQPKRRAPRAIAASRDRSHQALRDSPPMVARRRRSARARSARRRSPPAGRRAAVARRRSTHRRRPRRPAYRWPGRRAARPESSRRECRRAVRVHVVRIVGRGERLAKRALGQGGERRGIVGSPRRTSVETSDIACHHLNCVPPAASASRARSASAVSRARYGMSNRAAHRWHRRCRRARAPSPRADRTGSRRPSPPGSCAKRTRLDPPPQPAAAKEHHVVGHRPAKCLHRLAGADDRPHDQQRGSSRSAYHP